MFLVKVVELILLVPKIYISYISFVKKHVMLNEFSSTSGLVSSNLGLVGHQIHVLEGQGHDNGHGGPPGAGAHFCSS